MTHPEAYTEVVYGDEVVIPREQILRHVYRAGETFARGSRFEVLSAGAVEPPEFKGRYYHANIGTQQEPHILELRFEPTDHGFWIALLMTNERATRDLDIMADQITRRLDERQIDFDAVISPESLGPPLGNAIARLRGVHFPATSLQKGKPWTNEAGDIRIGPPKAWISMDDGIETSSGTSHGAVRQMLFLDPQWAALARRQQWRVLVVDDARLTGGTLDSALALVKRAGIQITAAATVLNEAETVENLGDIPYVWLTKLPLFDGEIGHLVPREGTYEGLDKFYVEV